MMKHKSTHTPEPLGVSLYVSGRVLLISPVDELIVQQLHAGLVRLYTRAAIGPSAAVAC
jgi:hypothetical protein